MSIQTEEHKECDTMGSQLQDEKVINGFYLVNNSPSFVELMKKEADKQYKFLRSRINKEIVRRKVDEQEINQKLRGFSWDDYNIILKTREIEDLKRSLRNVEPHLPSNMVTNSTSDRKHSQKKLIKKGRIDMEYLQQVEEELLSSKKLYGMTSSGTQELNNMIDIIGRRIQHGNNKQQADDLRIYHEMMEIRETYIAPEPNHPSDYWYPRETQSKRDLDWKRSRQHRLKIRLDDLEDLKMEQKRCIIRVTRLKAELEFVRKSISCLQKRLKDVDTKRSKTYKRAYKLGEQMKGSNQNNQKNNEIKYECLNF